METTPIEVLYSDVLTKEVHNTISVHPPIGYKMVQVGEEWIIFVTEDVNLALFILQTKYEARWFRYSVFKTEPAGGIGLEIDMDDLNKKAKEFFDAKGMNFTLKKTSDYGNDLVVIQKLKYQFHPIKEAV